MKSRNEMEREATEAFCWNWKERGDQSCCSGLMEDWLLSGISDQI